MTMQHLITSTVDEASGRAHRDDPVLGRSGGPAGNAHFTAVTGLVLLVLIVIESITALDVQGLISWHIVVGTLLVPPALLKTATTSWRIVRYYRGNPAYQHAGPPPMLLRVLGPLVVLTTLGVLATGLLLILLGPESGRKAFALGLDMLTLHQGMFIAFGVAVGLHFLARIYPAVLLATGRAARGGPSRRGVPGGPRRLVVLIAALAVGAVAGALVLGASGDWRKDRGGPFDGRHRDGLGVAVRP